MAATGKGNFGIQIIKFAMSSAQILAGGTKINILPAPGTGLAYHCHKAVLNRVFNTIAYVGNGSLLFLNDSLSVVAGNAMLSITSPFTFSSTTRITGATYATPGVGSNTVIENDGLSIAISATVPTLGDGTVNGFLYYSIIQVS